MTRDKVTYSCMEEYKKNSDRRSQPESDHMEEAFQLLGYLSGPITEEYEESELDPSKVDPPSTPGWVEVILEEYGIFYKDGVQIGFYSISSRGKYYMILRSNNRIWECREGEKGWNPMQRDPPF